MDLFKKIKTEQPKFPSRTISAEGKSFVLQLLSKKRENRLCFKNGSKEAKEHPWF